MNDEILNKLKNFLEEHKRIFIIIAVLAVLAVILVVIFSLNNKEDIDETDYVDISDAFRYSSELKSYEYRGDDKLLRLVYAVESDVDKPEGGFKVTSAKLHDYRAESNMLMLYATVYSESYVVNKDVIELDSSYSMPMAYIFTADTDLSAVNNPSDYDIEKLINSPVEIIQPKDGSYYRSSVEEFCKTPVTHEEIKGLADKIFDYDNNELIQMQKEHFYETIKANGYTIIQTLDDGASKKYKISTD